MGVDVSITRECDTKFDRYRKFWNKFDTNVKIWWFYNFVTFLWLTLPTKQSIIVYIIFFILKNIASRSLDVKSYIYKFQRRWIECMDIISSKINQTVLNMTVNYKKIIPIYFFIRFIKIYMKDKYVSMGLNYLVIIQCTCTLFIDWLESWHEFVASLICNDGRSRCSLYGYI